ncbi:sensor histidine kinase [Calothrix sp. NIES-3974]|uniref:sensor histidine kinase n=1 Tax=Calothrix sp. NIES-3974 TaxID=2005462 RepID=UPI002E803FC6|nr:GAF domain-containing protein [Calothrix sp. NIES-3974]
MTDTQMAQQQRPIAAEQHIISLGRVLQSLREEDNIDVLIETTIAFVKEQFDYRLIWVALYDRLNHVLVGKGGIIPNQERTLLEQHLVLSPGDLLEQVVIEQRPVGVADLRSETRIEPWQEVAKKVGIQGTIILPIRYRDRCLGILMMGSERWGYLLPGDARARLLMVLGELAAALYKYEVHWQQQNQQRIEEPLLKLLAQLQAQSSCLSRLEDAVRATHDFVTPTSTHIYWFDRNERYFVRRASSSSLTNSRLRERKGLDKITVEELSDFYYALAINETVAIGEGRSSLKSQYTAKLMERLQVRSLLAAPIFWQKDLLGFLMVESQEARIWKEGERNFVQGVAGLISLVAPLENIEATVREVQLDSQLTSEIAQGIYSDRDFANVMGKCATKTLERFAATRFILLQLDIEQNAYQIIYQSQPANRRPLTVTLEGLREVDWQLLQRSESAIGIESLEEDLRFFNWRNPLVAEGMRSQMITNCQPGESPHIILLVDCDSNRAWSIRDKDLLHRIGQQLHVVVRQWQLNNYNQQQQKIMAAFKASLRTLEQAQINALEQTNHNLEIVSLQQIAAISGCPLAVLISWTPGERYGEIIPGVNTDKRFAVKTEVTIPLRAEILVQWALAAEGLLIAKIDDIPEDTKRWLYGKEIGQVLIMALRTNPDYEPTGVVIMADRVDRRWSESTIQASEMLINQLAWSRRQKQVTQILLAAREDLQQLNWYKHRRFQELHRQSSYIINQLSELTTTNKELNSLRCHQLLRQLDTITSNIKDVLEDETWQLHIHQQKAPITSLLKRSLERVDNLLKQNRLWVGVHGLGGTGEPEGEQNYSPSFQSSLFVLGDIHKIEFILHELIVSACQRSTGSGRIDIWCRRLDERAIADSRPASLEVSITDNGVIESHLLMELHQETLSDVLAPSSLNQPPGLNLSICRHLIQKMGGELHFYQLPDGRVVSRLLLPLAIA